VKIRICMFFICASHPPKVERSALKSIHIKCQRRERRPSSSKTMPSSRRHDGHTRFIVPLTRSGTVTIDGTRHLVFFKADLII
jgi:hypothetical protein